MPEFNSTEELLNRKRVNEKLNGIKWVKKWTQIRSLKLLHIGQFFPSTEIHLPLRLWTDIHKIYDEQINSRSNIKNLKRCGLKWMEFGWRGQLMAFRQWGKKISVCN